MRKKHRNTAKMGEVQPCYYCGVPADTIDHVVPQVVLEMLRGMGHEAVAEQIGRRQVLTVPACLECNVCLGASIQPSLQARKRAAKDHLRRKYRRFIESDRWSQTELDELGPTLRRYVEQGESIKDFILRRLAW